MDKTCPPNCICKIININDPLIVRVNCSNANLKELPKVLPPNTQILNVAHNQVFTHLQHFIVAKGKLEISFADTKLDTHKGQSLLC